MKNQKNQIERYTILPNAERVRESERAEFVEEVRKGWINEKGYCPISSGPMGQRGYADKDWVNQPVRIVGYEDIPDVRSTGGTNTRFKKVRYVCGKNQDSMVIHIDVVNENPEIKGLKGLLIKNAILIKKR